MFFVSVASKGLRYCTSPLFATHTRGSQVLHLKDLRCTRIVLISRVLRGVDRHRRGQELAAIVPKAYCTREIWARQEKLAETGGASRLMGRERDDGQFGGERSNPQPFHRMLLPLGGHSN